MPYTEMPSHGPNFTRPPPNLIDGEEEYKVEQIRTHQRWGRHKTLQYLIKWKGYPKSDNTWEDTDQIHAPTLIKLYHQTKALEAIKACHTQLEYQHPSPLVLKTSTCRTTLTPTILRSSTNTLLWPQTHEDTIRLACSLPLALRVQSLSTLIPCTMPPESCAMLTGPILTLQTSTTSNDNSLYALHHLAPNPTCKCLPLVCTMLQTNHQVKPPFNYLPDSLQPQHRLPFPLTPSRQPYRLNQIWMPSSSKASLMACFKPSPIERLTLLYLQNDTKTGSTVRSNESSTLKALSMSHPQATSSTMGRSLTSTSPLVVGSIRKQNGSGSMTMAPSPATSALRAPMSSPT
jgi:Chromo (CHRromatin Organisation MOdifier) domain